MARSAHLLAFALALFRCTDESPIELPQVVASSKYVDYGAWADTSLLCMEDRLAAWDAYIEDISAFLGVPAPARRLRYTWVPETEKAIDTWPCRGAKGCARLNEDGYLARLYYVDLEGLHEFAHAVEIPAFGEAHPIFDEGMAVYLSEAISTDLTLPGFAADFVSMIDDDISSIYYRRSQQFVAFLIEKGGVEKYYEYRSLVGMGGYPEFSSAFRAVYGEDFDEALKTIELNPPEGRWLPWGCRADSEVLGWKQPGVLDADLHGECGDGQFYGGGFAEGQPGFSKVYTLDVPVAGVYELSVQGPAGTGEYRAEIVSCPKTKYGFIITSSEQPYSGILWQGRHQVRIDFPPAAASQGDAKLKLEFLIEAM